MAIKGGMFSPEEQAYLRTLPAVSEITDRRIMYSEAFKRDCLRRYDNGESPVAMFREAGLDPTLIGHKRIECCFARWRKNERLRQQDLTPNTESTTFAPLAKSDGDSVDLRDLMIVQQAKLIEELEEKIRVLSSRG